MRDKFEIARALREIGALLELEGENPFKVRAYENGARAVEALAEDPGALAAAGRLTEVPGIGEALAKKIADLHATGTTDLLERLRASHPPGTLELLRVPELGPRKAAALQAALGVGSVAELERACLEGRVRGVKGFGAKTEERILEGIRRLREREADRRVLLADALAAGDALVAHLSASPAAERVAIAGSARRFRETVADLDLVAASRDPAAVVGRLLAFPLVAEILARGPTKTTVRLASGLQVDLRVVPPEDWATLLHHLTGSKAHHVKLRGIARDAGYTLSEWGLFRLPPRGTGADRDPDLDPDRDRDRTVRPERSRRAAAAESKGESARVSDPDPDPDPDPDLDLDRDPDPDRPRARAPRRPPDPAAKVPIASEEELYAALGLAFVPPELREDEGELEAARAGTLPADLVRLEDVRGLVHCHTTWSDGRATLEEMARAAEALGFAYLTVTDHSRTAGYAGGLDEDRLRRQADELARVQEKVRVRLLHGTESDVLEDGALDFPDRVLESLDVIVASVHSRMKMDEDAMTRRLVRCMSLPVFKIWGHALGRLLLDRPSFACRVEEVLDALAGRGAVEVNGDPRRLELEPRWLRAATARGIPVVLSVDAHSVRDLGYLRYAAGVARRGWVRRGEVLNALPVGRFREAVRPAR